MARTKKTGLNYFPLDTNFFGNKKIVNINQKFGPAGPMSLLSIYSEIYNGKGYYLIFDMDMFDYLLYQTGLTEEKLFELLEHLNRRSILTIVSLKDSTATSFNQGMMPLLITAQSVQRQYQASIKTMKSSQEVDPVVWLLNEDETEDCISYSKISLFPMLTPLNPNNVNLCAWIKDEESITPDNSGIIGNIPEGSENIQGKAENPLYIKEKKIKEKKIKENILNNNEGTETEVSGGGVSDKQTRSKEDGRRKNNNYVPVSDVKNKIILGNFENVYLTGKELDKLKVNYPDSWEDIIETLSNYKASSGKGYKSDYAAMRTWVIKRVEEDKNRASPSGRKQENSSDDFLRQLATGEIKI